MTGHDYRSYSLSIKQALTLGLMEAGMEVHDIGLALSPVAYFAQFALDIPCVAMVTASHNENGWTGVKMGANKPLTFGPEEIGRLKDIVLGGEVQSAAGRQADPRRRHARTLHRGRRQGHQAVAQAEGGRARAATARRARLRRMRCAPWAPK